ncbi:MAG TPA: hypothetical protein VE439_06595 [Anaerolineae bacterium]|nr:hypothetical protein [Anaerolineae bacterium]
MNAVELPTYRKDKNALRKRAFFHPATAGSNFKGYYAALRKLKYALRTCSPQALAFSSSPSASGPSVPVTMKCCGEAIILLPILLSDPLIFLAALPARKLAKLVSKAAAVMPSC